MGARPPAGLFAGGRRQVTPSLIDPAQQQAALHIAARVLREQYPNRTSVTVPVQVGPNSIHAVAALVWPGVVRVTLKHDGQFIAQSIAGQPDKLDSSVLA